MKLLLFGECGDALDVFCDEIFARLVFNQHEHGEQVPSALEVHHLLLASLHASVFSNHFSKSYVWDVLPIM